MIWFKNKPRQLSGGQIRIAERIAGRILNGQRRAANCLNDKTKRISRKGWLILLICFCACFGGYCLSLLLQIL